MRRFDLPGRSPVYSENGMAATSHPLATLSAIDILKRGGNAVDAAVAASATLTVVEPHIDRDRRRLLRDRRRAGRDRAWPQRLRPRGGRRRSGLVSQPGISRDPGDRAACRHGARRDQCLGDAAFQARHAAVRRPCSPMRSGWPRKVFRCIRASAGTGRGKSMRLPPTRAASRHYLVGGKAPAIGTRQRQPALAETLRAIARDGAKAFYEGPVAAEIAATVRRLGGFLSEADLAAVAADWVEPISARYAGHDVLEIPPNGQGITALIMFRLLQMVGAERDRSRRRRTLPSGDRGRTARLFGARPHGRRSGSDDGRARRSSCRTASSRRWPPASIVAGAIRISRCRRQPNADTIYLTVVDRDRRAVSFINSTYDSFGAKIVTPVSGVILQNRGACFSLVKGHPNEIGPGKRPMHTIIPAMAMKDGKAAVAFGVMGGAFQPMGHVHVFSNLADHGMDPQAGDRSSAPVLGRRRRRSRPRAASAKACGAS